MKQFFTSAAEKMRDADGQVVDDREYHEFEHDGTVVRFAMPNPAQLGVMMSLGGKNMKLENFGTFMSFFFALMDHPTQLYFKERLLDPEDPIADLTEEGSVVDVFEYLTKEVWVPALPTNGPSDYRPSQRSTGQSSTVKPPRRASTTSTSARRGSTR